MALWNDKVLPRLIDRGMRNDVMAENRHHAAPLATGRVLEIGFGSGLNVPLYGNSVEHLFGLEPSAVLCEKSAELTEAAALQIDVLQAGAEAIPLDTDDIDTVVSSWTLCSIKEIETALQEIRRVLRPDGRFVFIEHGRAPDKNVSNWQDRLEPLTVPILGCRLNREIDTLVEQAGFRMTSIDKHYLSGPKLISYHYVGQAQPV